MSVGMGKKLNVCWGLNRFTSGSPPAPPRISRRGKYHSIPLQALPANRCHLATVARRAPGFLLRSAVRCRRQKHLLLLPSCCSGRTIPSREIQNLDGGFSRPELPEDFRFALSSRNSFSQDLFDRSTVQDNHAVRCADNDVARTNCNSAHVDWFVQRANLFFLASANR